jgi:hypothetical protein
MSYSASPSGDSYQANLYPAVEQQGASSPLGAVCFSGGGSRALTCALGQLSALSSLPGVNQQTLLQNFSFISSVSGGSWASVLYTFLPPQYSLQDFLISLSAPSSLTQTAMQSMAATCLGSVPQQFDLDNMGSFIYKLYEWGFFDPGSGMGPWFWIAGVGEFVLKAFDLYSPTYSPDAPYLLPGGPFSVSQTYVNENLVPNNPGLSSVPFYTVARGRPTLIVNFNLLNGDYLTDPPQMPVQATAVSTGSVGSTPGQSIVAGGSVESFGFTSTLDDGTPDKGASVSINRWYSLCDIAGCSSAFFAEYLLEYIDLYINKLVDAIATKYNLTPFEKEALELVLTAFLDIEGQEIIPAYNYWRLGQIGASNPANTIYGFSDGGDFDNTGILGALAQTGVNRIVSFTNSEVPINQVDSAYFVDPSLPLLFGSYYPAANGGDGTQPYKSFDGMSPEEPMSYVQVFDNSNGELDALCAGLYNASCGGPGQDSNLGTYTAFFTQNLTTVANPVAGIAAGREVTVVWIYNNRVNSWQNQITDAGLLADLKNGQSNQASNGNPIKDDPPATGPLANFPHYFTGEQIFLYPEAVNMLAQLSAWNVQQAQTQIQALFSS